MILTLVRLLRQTRQLDEAVRLLADLAQRIPTRAREAHIQIADIELGRYEDQQALDHASSAARLAPDDGRALIRIAEVQERAGEIDAALANYRRAFGRDANPSAAFALARLLARRGSTAEASEILRGVLRAASDEETITETGRRAIDLEEYLGTLDDLERVVSGLLFSNPNGAAYRRLLAEIYRRLLPSLYRAPAVETAAAENRARIAQHGLRPLLELVTEADGDPERGLIELLGMLGNRDAAPALARLAQGSVGSSGEALLRTSSGSGNETQLTAIIALGRLGDARARPALETLVAAPDTTVRVAAVWALGRMATPETGELLAAQTSSHLDVAGFAYLGLGRTGDHRWGADLARAAQDPSQPPKLRRAAAVALGLSRNRAGVPALMSLLDSSSDELARAGAAALGALGDTSLLPSLFERALLDPTAITGAETPALAAIDRLIGNAPIEDEAKAIDGTRLDLEAMLDVLTVPPPRVARERSRARPGSRARARSRRCSAARSTAIAGSGSWRCRRWTRAPTGRGWACWRPTGARRWRRRPRQRCSASGGRCGRGSSRCWTMARPRCARWRCGSRPRSEATGPASRWLSRRRESSPRPPRRQSCSRKPPPSRWPRSPPATPRCGRRSFARGRAAAGRLPRRGSAAWPRSRCWRRPVPPRALCSRRRPRTPPPSSARRRSPSGRPPARPRSWWRGRPTPPRPFEPRRRALWLDGRRPRPPPEREALPASLAPLLARLSHDPSDLVRGALAHLEP